MQTETDCKQIKELVAGYKPKNVYNVVVTFWPVLDEPSKTLTICHEKFTDSKTYKKKITVLICTNH